MHSGSTSPPKSLPTSETAYAGSTTSTTSETPSLSGPISSASPQASSESLPETELDEYLDELSGALPPFDELFSDTDGKWEVTQSTSEEERVAEGIGLDAFMGWQLADNGAMLPRVMVPAAPAASDEEAAERMHTLGGLAQHLFEELARWRRCTLRLSRDRHLQRRIARPRKRRRSAGLKSDEVQGSDERAPSQAPSPPPHPPTPFQTPPLRCSNRQEFEAATRRGGGGHRGGGDGGGDGGGGTGNSGVVADGSGGNARRR